MNQSLTDKAEALWQRLIERHGAYRLALIDFLARKDERLAILRNALRGPERDTALTIADSLSTDELQELFAEWVHLARCAHGPFSAAWRIILSLPRDWVLSHIEQEVEPILSNNNEEDDYWMFLQLYERLDRELALKLARRAALHADPAIRGLGEDFLDRLAKGAPTSDRLTLDPGHS